MIWCLERFVKGLEIDYQEASELALWIGKDPERSGAELEQSQNDVIITFASVSSPPPYQMVSATIIVAFG